MVEKKTGQYLSNIHPLFFTLFPILFLYAQNAYEMRLKELFGPLVVGVAGVIVLTIVLSLVFRSLSKGVLMTTIVIILFYTYGHIVNLLPDFRFFFSETEIGRNGLVIVIWSIIIYYSAKIIFKSKRDFFPINRALTYIGLMLVVLQLIHGGYVLATRTATVDKSKEIVTTRSTRFSEKRPDIYYIIMDGYGRSDILKELYHYNNDEFIHYLKARGFYVADHSHSNYCQTLLSLGATLNLNYVDDLGDFSRSLIDRMPLHEKLQNNEVFRFLREFGYKITAFASGSDHTDFENADLYFTPGWMTNEFESILISTTPLPLFLFNEKSPYAQHRKRIKYILNKVSDIYEVSSPRFIFAHLLSPHPPFVFDADGEAVEPNRSFYAGDGSHFRDRGGTVEEYLAGYKNQITYITKQLQNTIEQIFASAGDNPPIIILQADHGPGSGLSWLGLAETNVKERFSILNAVYLPGGDTSKFYSHFSPVNTFRVIFNEYFNTDYELLPDRSFYATWAHPFNFLEVTRQLGPDIYKPRFYPRPVVVAYETINEPKPQGTKFDTEGCYLVTDDGLRVNFNSLRNNAALDISVDNNDDYTLYFRRDTALIARWNISPRIIKEGGLRMDKVIIPQTATKEGYDNILIVPYGGDQRYSVGHLRLL